MLVEMEFVDYIYMLDEFIDAQGLGGVVKQLFGKPLYEAQEDHSDFFILCEVLDHVPEKYWVCDENGFFRVYKVVTE